ncbi:hypothetical protein tb265_47350 [Gemmatimonadetes bacterium T265]|nr:hypothetical protein tb265_47350 [Gemmatimonadetes bacterium T265]
MRAFGLRRARYRGLAKTHCEIAGAPHRRLAAGAYWKVVAGGMTRRLTRRLLIRGRALCVDMSPVRDPTSAGPRLLA